MTSSFVFHGASVEPVHFAENDIIGEGCLSHAEGYYCTGPEGHDGRHHADGTRRCWASWGGGDEA